MQETYFVIETRFESKHVVLPGLPAASYYSGDLLNQPEQVDVLCSQRRRYRREFGFCLFTAECILFLAVLCKDKKVLEAGSGSGWFARPVANIEKSMTDRISHDYMLTVGTLTLDIWWHICFNARCSKIERTYA